MTNHRPVSDANPVIPISTTKYLLLSYYSTCHHTNISHNGTSKHSIERTAHPSSLTIEKKAKKELASRNAARLQQTRYITIAVHSFFILLRWFLSSLSPKSVLVYLLLSAPSFFIQFWFEQVGSPKYGVDGPQGGELLRSGEDLEAKGLTEFLWDILFWSWGCVSFAAAFGDRAWWLYVGTILAQVVAVD